MLLRTAYDVHSNDVLQCVSSRALRRFIMAALLNRAGHYIFANVFLIFKGIAACTKYSLRLMTFFAHSIDTL